MIEPDPVIARAARRARNRARADLNQRLDDLCARWGMDPEEAWHRESRAARFAPMREKLAALRAATDRLAAIGAAFGAPITRSD